jgi:hypothetical protein
MLGTISINKTRRLAHIDFFLQYTMKKSVLNIQLTQRLASRNSQREQETDSRMLDDRTKVSA